MANKPSVTDPEAIEALREYLIGGMSMTQACAMPECPSKSEVYARMAKDDEFRTIIACAREAQQHAAIEDTVDMADNATPEDWQVVKLRIWARQWRAGKIAPRTYGDKLELAGEVGIKEIPDDRLQSRLTLLLGTAGVAGYLGGDGAQEAPPEDTGLLPGDGAASS